MKRLLFFLMIFLALLTAILIPSGFFTSPFTGILATKTKELLANQYYIDSFFIHVYIGGIALGVGWLNFVNSIRVKYLQFHRIIGRIYVLTFLITAITSVVVSYHAYGGIVSQFGFIFIGLIAIFTTLMGFAAIVNGNLKSHQVWMRYSYASCLASVTLRIWSPILGLIMEDELLIYQIVAWLSWVPNLLFVRFYLNRK
ncbi:DUF2306 domain-containing protein [Lacihabitans sp. LS3-19]|uniref:DUF2306 domain-containing protein n=1 Tax=Lacihabitans sp. LS3-19 TaxID=2487335 RepID=UPI0020CECE0F|nr:DUF2306 domain-containing protein [Lacihabitans sp. LS3-19]MCP9767222.1 DUF2306 domain-containing protein [Lacihabitans sp. LS3-19]